MPEDVWKHVQNLKRENSYERSGAATALGEIKHESAVPSLIETLKDERPEVREIASNALGRIGEPAVPHLIQALKNEHRAVRENAARALGLIKHENAVPALIQALKDENWDVRERAAKALGEIKHENAVKPLTKALLKDKDPDVKESAAWALFTIARSLTEKQEKGKKITPEGEKLLKTIALFKTLLVPHFREDESGHFKARALHAAYNSKEGEIDESNARLFIKQLRAHEGNLK